MAASSPNRLSLTGGISARRGAQLATLVVFVAFLDFFIGLPIVPTYARDLGASPTMVGVIVGAYSITNLVGNVGAGYFLDRFGRRAPITLGLVLTAAALAGYALASNWEMLLAVRGLHGLTAAVLTPGAFAMLGDSSPTHSRARMMGRSAAGIAIAAIVGPLSAGILADRIGYEPVFLIAAGLMAVTAIVYVIGSRDTATDATEQAETTDGEVRTGTEPFNIVGLAVASFVALALTIGIGTLATYMPLHVEELGQTSRTSGAAFTLYAVTALAMMLGGIGVIGDKYGRLVLVAAGLSLFGGGLVLMAWTPELWGVFAGMGIIGLGFGLLFPAAAALVADSGGADRRGLAFGIFYGAYSLGVAVGAGLSGQLADTIDGVTGVPYAVAAAVIAVCIVVVLASITRGIGAVQRHGGGTA